MPPTVRLTVITGPHKNGRFCFRGPADCTVGRGDDCFVQLAGEERDRTISGYHCELAVLSTDPPCIRIEDLSSLNGTYVNGKRVKPIDPHLGYLGSLVRDLCVSTLKDGDIITVGGTSLRVDIVNCPPADISVESVWEPGQTAKKDCDVKCSPPSLRTFDAFRQS